MYSCTSSLQFSPSNTVTLIGFHALVNNVSGYISPCHNTDAVEGKDMCICFRALRVHNCPLVIGFRELVY